MMDALGMVLGTGVVLYLLCLVLVGLIGLARMIVGWF